MTCQLNQQRIVAKVCNEELEVIRTGIAVIFGSSILKQHTHEKSDLAKLDLADLAGLDNSACKSIDFASVCSTIAKAATLKLKFPNLCTNIKNTYSAVEDNKRKYNRHESQICLKYFVESSLKISSILKPQL